MSDPAPPESRAPGVLFEESEGCVLGADKLTLNAHGAKSWEGARGSIGAQADTHLSFDVQVIAVSHTEPQNGRQPVTWHDARAGQCSEL